MTCMGAVSASSIVDDSIYLDTMLEAETAPIQVMNKTVKNNNLYFKFMLQPHLIYY